MENQKVQRSDNTGRMLETHPQLEPEHEPLLPSFFAQPRFMRKTYTGEKDQRKHWDAPAARYVIRIDVWYQKRVVA